MGTIAFQDSDHKVFEIFGTVRASIEPGTFLLHTSRLIMAADNYIEAHIKYFSDVDKSTSRFREYERVRRLREFVVRNDGPDTSLVLPQNHDSTVKFLVPEIIGDRQFISVTCPRCDLEYEPSEIGESHWEMFGDGAFAKGRDFRCVKDHIIYVTLDSIEIFH